MMSKQDAKTATKPRPSLKQTQRAASDLLLDLAGLPDLVTAFLRGADMAPTTFGRKALAQQDFVRLLNEGRFHRLDTITKALKYIATFKT